MNPLIRELKDVNEDFEFYPTTDEIISSIQMDINKQFAGFNSVEPYSLLDCGAGDGRVLTKLKTGDLYAIEKSKKLSLIGVITKIKILCLKMEKY